ncbi:hypothetical protein [Massilia sp.]|uniref:hypothetical protein n=1 Tax=Massilia sp. TaxID=1882437 RepID=UPI00352ED0E1
MSRTVGLRRAGTSMSNAEKLRRRDAACVRIRELLAAKPMSVAVIASELCLNTGTVYGYLCFLAEIGEVRRAGNPGARRPLWELGVEDAAKLEAHAMRPPGVVIVPAVQVGMWRDPLDVALFGPARGGVAC